MGSGDPPSGPPAVLHLLSAVHPQMGGGDRGGMHSFCAPLEMSWPSPAWLCHLALRLGTEVLGDGYLWVLVISFTVALLHSLGKRCSPWRLHRGLKMPMFGLSFALSLPSANFYWVPSVHQAHVRHVKVPVYILLGEGAGR